MTSDVGAIRAVFLRCLHIAVGVIANAPAIGRGRPVEAVVDIGGIGDRHRKVIGIFAARGIQHLFGNPYLDGRSMTTDKARNWMRAITYCVPIIDGKFKQLTLGVLQ